MQSIRVLTLGDVVGKPGRDLVIARLSDLKIKYRADLIIVNAENAAGGMGLSAEIGNDLLRAGVDLITLGDHTWGRHDIKPFLERNSARCIRPANYPEGAPGSGWSIVETKAGIKVGVFNLLGRVFINGALDCPFKKLDQILDGPLSECKIRICDMHAEATSEKLALARYADGRVSFVFGTHTHVQTSDNQVLSRGTGYISDIGMCGPMDSVLGLKNEISIARFLTGMRYSYEVGAGPEELHGAVCEIDFDTGKAISVERVLER